MKKSIIFALLLSPVCAGAQLAPEVSTGTEAALSASGAAAELESKASVAKSAVDTFNDNTHRPAAPAGKYQLMGTLDLYGGQYFFGGQSGALNGYGVLNAELAKSYSSSYGYYLSLNSVYTGFKQVNELAGGGTLFQQSLDNSLGLKWIKRYDGGYALKPHVGVTSELFRETKDEKWGQGLYDFTRYEAGLTLERKTRAGFEVPWTYQLSWDAYYTRYTRFKSLASEYGAELAAPDPGSRVLDAVTNQFSYYNEWDLPGFAKAEALASLAVTGYPEQKVINSAGTYLPSTRSDYYELLTLSISKRYSDAEILGGIRPVAGFGLTFDDQVSNQNHLDTEPAHLKFIRSFYDYYETTLSPTLMLTSVSSGFVLSANYNFTARWYPDRLTQTTAGSYTGDKLRQYTCDFGLEASYPITASLDARLRTDWSLSRSNNRYEQVYRYNYDSSTYFAGIEWRF